MAINASMQWWIRQSGNALNGGGFDSAVTNAGTNYADQDAPQLSLTDLATSAANSTTLTSATGGFTSAMIGNVIRIASGTNFTAGYYVVTAYTDTNTVTLDRTPSSAGAGSSGVGRLGGAFSQPWASLANSGPTIATPLAAGHTVNVRGSGSTNPSTPDYTQTGFSTYASGDTTNGLVSWVGYNGRPLWQGNGLTIYQTSGHHFQNLFFRANGTSNGGQGIANGSSAFYDCWFDQNGNDVALIGGGNHIAGCRFFNSGSTTPGTSDAVTTAQFGSTVFANVFQNVKAGAINTGQNGGQIIGNLIFGCKGTNYAITIPAGGNPIYSSVIGNTIANNAGDGIRITSAQAVALTIVFNNIVSGNGGYGKRITVGTAALNNRILRRLCGNNNYYGNALGATLNSGVDASDFSLDPQFTNTSLTDFSIGQNMKAIAFPASFAGTGTTNYADLGAVQAIASGGGLLLPRAMNGGYSA